MSHFCEKNGIKWWGKIRIKSHIKISQGYINHKKDPPNQGNASSVKKVDTCTTFHVEKKRNLIIIGHIGKRKKTQNK